eukprot:CAMPEP_0117681430 /NCGR_PEP_ID=MMETSP0804-20121206/18979_1 /TAXON_ID=1074897 /ORGANISM="Tetraselmis astigmatica, Strain CCMP880" /LENGTH=276 /DNA_ID=CAMNT_0005491189 /DNA_START=280 /DNA_END=1106 /DNA_ORIENTATION=-
MSFQEFNRDMGRPGGGARAGGAAGSGSSGEYQAAVSQVFQMSTSLTNLRRVVDMLGGPKDTVELRTRASEVKEKIAHLAKGVTASLHKLQSREAASSIPGDPKVAVAKLASDFEGILKEFQRVQKLLADRGTRSRPKDSHSSAYAPQEASSASVSLEQQEEQALIAREQNKQEMLQLDNMIDYNQALIEERDEGIAEIQQQIGEVNEMFQDLAVLVNDQGAQLLDIESNVFTTAQHTADARDQLIKAQRSQKRSRRCWCWMALVVFIMLAMLMFIL